MIAFLNGSGLVLSPHVASKNKVSSKRVGLSQFRFSADGSALRYPEGMKRDSQPNENETTNITSTLLTKAKK